MSKHTPKPWVLNRAETQIDLSEIWDGEEIVCEIYNQERASRIVSCVNACADIEHPELWVKEAKAILIKLFHFEHSEMKIGDSRIETLLRFAKERDELKAQRDELLSALEESTEYVFYARRFKFRKIVEKYKSHETPPQP